MSDGGGAANGATRRTRQRDKSKPAKEKEDEMELASRAMEIGTSGVNAIRSGVHKVTDAIEDIKDEIDEDLSQGGAARWYQCGPCAPKHVVKIQIIGGLPEGAIPVIFKRTTRIGKLKKKAVKTGRLGSVVPDRFYLDESGKSSPIDESLLVKDVLRDNDVQFLWFDKKMKNHAEEEARRAAKRREQEKIKKPFYFKISDVTANFEKKFDSVFLEFIVGGNTRDVTSSEAEEKVVMKKTKDEEGNTVEKAYKMKVFRKQTQVVTEYSGRWFTRSQRNIKVREDRSFQNHNFSGMYYGTYKDLEEEFFTIRAWHTTWLGPNEVIGEGKETLYQIVQDKVDRQLILKHVSEGGRKTDAARITYKLVFQEEFPFQIDIHDWEADTKPEEEEEESDEDEEALRPRVQDPLLIANSAEAKALELEERKKRKKKRRKPKLQRHRLVFNLSDSHVGVFTRCFEVLFQCKLRDPRYTSLDLVDGSSHRGRGSVFYTGTRSRLEDEELTIQLLKLNSFLGMFPRVIASKRVSLQGVLDHGYLLSYLDYSPGWIPKSLLPTRLRPSRKCNCFSCLSCLPCKKKKTKDNTGAASETEVELDSDDDSADEEERWRRSLPKLKVKGVVDALEKPLYRQLGNVGRPQGASRWFQMSKGDAYLVVHIIKAKGLQSLDEFKETLNPFVIVSWSGIRKQTKIISRNPEPFWDDDVFFKIPDIEASPPEFLEDFGHVARNSKLTLTVWDAGHLTKSPLGHCEIDFEKIYGQRTLKSVEDTKRKGRKTKQWVFEAKAELTVPSTQLFETDFDDKPIRVTDEDAEENRKAATRYIELYCYFEMDGQKIERPKYKDATRSVRKKKDAKIDPNNPFDVKPSDLMDPTPMHIKQIRRSQAFWEESLKLVPNFRHRSFAFLGKDQYSGGIFFLPTFVKPMHPPTEIQDLDNLFYFLHCIEFYQKPVIEYDELKPSSVLHDMKNIWVWSDPFFFLERKKGDVVDHALLLCNYLLGLSIDAWVAIGTVRVKGSKSGRRRQHHVWVVTKHDFFDTDEELAKLGVNPALAALPAVDDKALEVMDTNHDGIITQEEFDYADPTEEKKGLSSVLGQGLKGAKFLAGGAKFIAGGALKVAGTAKNLAGDVAGAAYSRALAVAEAARAAAVAAQEKIMAKRAEQMKNNPPTVRFWEVTNNKTYILKGGYLCEPDEKLEDPLEQDRLNNNFYTDDGELDLQGIEKKLEMNDNAIIGLTEEQTVLDVDKPYDDLFDMERSSRIEVHREILAEQRETLEPLKLKPEDMGKQKKKAKASTPYLTLDVVFNHRGLYANLQSENPEEIKFDFSNRARWRKYPKKKWEEFVHTSKITPHYPDRIPPSIPAREKEIMELSIEILERIKSTIRSHREYQFHADTEFYDEFHFVMGVQDATEYVARRLALEEQVVKCQDLIELSEQVKIKAEDDEREVITERELEKEREKWRKKILESLDQKSKYTEKLLHFKHANGNRISDSIIEQCSLDKKTNILGLEAEQDPVYLVGVKIERMPSLVTPVRVFIAATFQTE